MAELNNPSNISLLDRSDLLFDLSSSDPANDLGLVTKSPQESGSEAIAPTEVAQYSGDSTDLPMISYDSETSFFNDSYSDRSIALSDADLGISSDSQPQDLLSEEPADPIIGTVNINDGEKLPDELPDQDIVTNPDLPTNISVISVIPELTDNFDNESFPETIPVGEKHDRSESLLETDNVSTVMLRPPALSENESLPETDNLSTGGRSLTVTDIGVEPADNSPSGFAPTNGDNSDNKSLPETISELTDNFTNESLPETMPVGAKPDGSESLLETDNLSTGMLRPPALSGSESLLETDQGRSLTVTDIGVEPADNSPSGFAPTNADNSPNESLPETIPVGAKHDRSESLLETDNLSTVMLRPPVTDMGVEPADNSPKSNAAPTNADNSSKSNESLPAITETFKSGIFTVGSDGKIGIDFLYDGGWYQGQLAIFNLEGMEQYEPGSADFIREAAVRAASNSELGYIVIDDLTEGARFSGVLGESSQNKGDYQGVKSFALNPGSTFGVMLIPNGKVAEVAENPSISGNKRPLFSMVTANPNLGFHLGQIADVTGEGNTFVLEDLRVDKGSDRDYNDIIFQVRGAVGTAALMDEVVATNKDWRNSDLGQALIAYAKTYVNPDFLETSDSVDPDSSLDSGIDLGEDDLSTSIDNNQDIDSNDSSDAIADSGVDSGIDLGEDDLATSIDNNQDIDSTDSSDAIADSGVDSGIDLGEDDLATSIDNNQDIDSTDSSDAIADTGVDPVDDDLSTSIDNNQDSNNGETEEILAPSTGELPLPTSPAITQNQLLSIADAKQLISSLDMMRSLGQEIPQELVELAEKSLAYNQPTVTPEVPATPSNPTDILTGATIPTIPTASIPKLEILAPESNQGNRPLIGQISPSDNQPQNWASALVEFVNTAVKSGQKNAVVNLNIDLTKIQNSGNSTGKSQLTIEEKAALLYAQENQVLVVVPVGDTPGQISAIAQASKEFNNIITVGAAQRVNDSVAVSKAFAASPNSGSGSALDIVAEATNGSSSVTTVASAKVTDTISQAWAANSQLNYTQILDIVKNTATDLGQQNWDSLTGVGMVNTEAAVWLAKATEPQPISPGKSRVTSTISVQPLADIILTPGQPSTNLDLSQVFAGNGLTYEIIGGASDAVNLKLTGGQLQLTGLDKSGIAEVTIRAIAPTGKSAETKFSVTNYYLEKASVDAMNNALTDLTSAINSIPGDLIAALSSDKTEGALDILIGILEENTQLIQLLANPETLKNFGLDSNNLGTIQQLLQSPELAAEFGLPVPLGEALSNPDSTLLDNFLLNADEAVHLLPENAKQPKVGFIDFSEGNHINKVTNAFASINPLANYDQFKVTGGNWAEQLVKFVDKVKRAGETHAIANLSFDLSQLDDIGITTRYELTPEEQQAIQYAKDNNVLLMVAAGNTGNVMSALGQASQKFDNIITVGAVNQFQSKTDYSAYGNGLTLMAPGGSWHNDAGAFVGTSRATAYVSAAASLIWAANPALSYQQVKQLLIDTAADLDVEGWDVLTGAGLIDIKEALDRAFFVEPEEEKPGFSEKPGFWEPFSGAGRAKTLARAAGDNTEQAITELDNIQQTLLEQWQVLADLGNPALTLDELDAEVKAKIAEAFATYQQVSTDAAITTAQAQQWAEALALATQHYQIEQGRLLNLQARQKELEEQLAGLGQQKTALEAETQKLLDGIKAAIAKAEEDLAKSQAKLANPFANADDNLQFNSQSFWNAATGQQQLAQNFRQQAAALAAESQHYQAVANSINPYRWQVVGSRKTASGRRKEVWDWGQNPQLVKQKNQYQWLAGITALNSQLLQQLAAQTDQQKAALQSYGNLLEDRKNTLNLGSGSADDADTVLQLLQEQAAQQQALANNYAQQANIAEKRRQQSQANADWHNSLINRWEVVGTKRGKSGKSQDVWGWRHYPEHIAPRDRAQQLAWQANAERQNYAQLAQQAQQQASALAEQARKLQERLRDWPVLKQGIEYEIAADSLRLQAEQDLLAMHEPVQEQKLETLNLQISQAEAQLQTLTDEKLPAQQQLTDATEQRLQETQSEVAAIQQERETAQKDLQNFLETAGFLLPYRERLAAVEKTIQQLEDDKLRVQETMQALTIALLQTPSDALMQQLNHWGNYVETLEQELDWAKLQKDQLALALTDSPERLAISGLIKELEAEKGTAVADDVPLQRYIDFLRGIEGSGADFLEGFDNLEQRLAAAKIEQKDAEAALKQLQDEYRNLGLQKSNLEDKLIPAKEQEIKATQADIAATETTLANLQTQLAGLQNDQAQKAVEVANQEAVVAATQAQTQAEIANLQNQINAKDVQIQEQQALANSYPPQIQANYNAAAWYEGQRVYHQNSANYWIGQIYTQQIVGYQRFLWWQIPVYASVYNPQAEANRKAHQDAANINAQYRNDANQQAQQLTNALNATNKQINALNQEKASLVQQQQAQRDTLAAEQATMQRLQQQLQAISQQINALQANIQQQEQQLDGLNNLLAQQQQQLADLQAQIPILEQQLIDKYRQIELTENYLSQVEAEVNRLDARLDLLNKAGVLEQKYQDNWQKWQQATLAQTQATEALIATRQAGESDRALLASLQSQLTQAQTNLQTAQTLQQSITDTLQAVEFSKLQLGNQQLLMQSLIDRENSLAALERYYLNLSEQHRQRIWATGGYNAGEAAAYRNYLEQASFIADLRNKLWQQRQETQQKINQLNQQIAQQQSQIATQQSQLAALGGIAQVQAQITQINAAINAVNQRLNPLEILEKQQTQAIANAGTLTEHLTSELVQTAQLQATALRQLIGFGILASESDVDFFLTQVEPNVNSAIEKLRKREQELTAQVESAALRTATAQEQLANTTDEVSKQALTNLIAQLQGQQSNLEELKAQNQHAADELEDLLQQANDSLTPLRQKQELEIRQKLESNDERLQALQSQLNSENAAENAVNTDTVLAYAQLTDQIRQDLTLNASNWTQQLLDGNQMTKELGTSQHTLSAAVDELIAYINDNFADPHGEYNRSEADLRDGITTLGVVENRADELDSAFTSTEDAIERIKLRIAQDAALWDEIAPIAIRYGLESDENKGLIAQYLAIEKEKQERLRLSEGYNYIVNPENGNRYFLTKAATTWHGAQAEAQRVGGNLVTIRNSAEQDFVRKMLGQQSVWMGLTDEGHEGHWRWVSGEPVTYTNFRPGQPDNYGGGENWAEFIGQWSGQWNDALSWNGFWQNAKPGLVEVSVKDLEYKQKAIAAKLSAWAKEHGLENALDLSNLSKYPDGAAAIDFLVKVTRDGSNPQWQISQQLNAPNADTLLNAPAVEGRNPLQALFDKSKAAQASHEAQGYALLAQAAWYEQRAAYHWAVSRKNGPTWTEWRRVCKRRFLRRKKCWDEPVTHVDYNWIIWQQYSQIFPQLRQQGMAHLVEADKWRKEKERLEPLKNQWIEANDAANEANPVVKEARNFFAELEAARDEIPQAQTQLASLETLLPILKQQLEEAEAEAQAQNAKVQQQWEEYDTDSEEYRAAVADILERRGELNKQAIETQQQLAESERWVEQQTVALSAELDGVKTLIADLQQQRQDIQQEIMNLVALGVMVDDLDELNTKDSLLEQSLQMLTNKAAVLTAEQTSLTQKRTLLTAQNEVILAEQRLLDAYINDPDADTSNLEQQLLDARAALAEAQRLAEQAEAASKALTAPLQEIKTDLLAQNDEHLKAAKEHQQILRALVEATQSNANYSLQAAQKQQEVNNLDSQIVQRLQQATAAGYQEAKHLWDVAQANDMATTAEIYYRDYNDLAGDKGGKCTPGLARPEDRILADQYYQQMLNQRELQRRAQAQANAFRVAKETAQAQMTVLQQQKETAQQLLDEINAKVAETQEQREQKEQELAIAQARLDGITRIREQTEQTLIQLVTLEKLNLAQADLEKEIAKNRQADIDEAVAARQERDALELERKRLETQARIEQLRQLQAEDDLRQNLNQVRSQLGLATLDATDDPVQLQTQLAGLLTNLQDLTTQQPDLPENVKALLAEAQGDIHLALQGKEAANIQQNLLNAMDGLVAQIESYKTEINRIDLEEQWDNQLLQTAQSDLQGASQQLLKELDRAAALSGEHDVIDPLYMEALNKIALAQQAVDISEEMAEQGKEMLDQIIKQRIAERKARKKAFWNKILGIVSTVFSLIGTVLTFIPGANLVGLALGAVGGAISAVQAAINGDWMGAIFSAVMAGASFVGGAIGNGLKAGQAMVMGMTKAVAQKVLSTIKAFQSLASGAFNGVRNLLSGDKIMGFLQIMGGLAGAATSGLQNAILSSPLGEFGYKVVESLSKAPTLIYGGIKAIQSGDWVGGIGNIIKGIVSLGKTWTNDFNDGVESPGEKIANILENISSVGIGVSKFITGGLEGLLEGLGDILDGLGDDIQKWVENISGKDECQCPPEPECDPCQSNATYTVDENGNITGADIKIGSKTAHLYAVGPDGEPVPIDPNKPTVIVTHGYISSGQAVSGLADSYKDNYADYNVIILDWNDLAKSGILPLWPPIFDYRRAADNTQFVGYALGQTILNLGIDPQQTTLIGHSLGARVSQYAANYVRQYSDNGSLINNLVLLDPAGPGFEPRLWDLITGGYHNLPQGDIANNTVAIHSTTVWGDQRPIYDHDIYINPPDIIPNAQIGEHSYPIKYLEDLVRSSLDLQQLSIKYAAP